MPFYYSLFFPIYTLSCLGCKYYLDNLLFYVAIYMVLIVRKLISL